MLSSQTCGRHNLSTPPLTVPTDRGLLDSHFVCWEALVSQLVAILGRGEAQSWFQTEWEEDRHPHKDNKGSGPNQTTNTSGNTSYLTNECQTPLPETPSTLSMSNHNITGAGTWGTSMRPNGEDHCRMDTAPLTWVSSSSHGAPFSRARHCLSNHLLSF